jgi:ABC-type arginine transport system ATPase subunit
MKVLLQKYNMTVPSVMAVEEKMFSLDPEIKAKIVRDFDEITNLIVKLGSPIV